MANNNGFQAGYQKNGGPPCPKIERLEELMDRLNECEGAHDDPPKNVKELSRAELIELGTALDWTHTMLSNRKTYQLKNNLKKNAFQRIAKSMLSQDEKDQIDAQVKEQLKGLVAE